MLKEILEEQKTTNGHGIATMSIPTPTNWYRTHRKTRMVTMEPTALPIPIPIPIPLPLPRLMNGPRVLMWKQDPTVSEIGIRRAYLPKPVLTGPRDARINSQGIAAVSSNRFGDFIQTPGTDEFDAVHTFTVVRQTLTMFQRALAGSPPNIRVVPWQWNSPTNTDPLYVHAHGLPNVMNAYYSRGSKALKFGDFNMPGTVPPERVYTCRSLDIVSHETGHAILDGLKPGWLGYGNPPQTGGLHESVGDLTAIFLALSQLDQVEAIIAFTKGDLHNKNFLADLAEQFGLALGRSNGLRNADNNLKLSEVSNEVHELSQVFTGAIYDILADIYALERDPARKDDAAVLYEVGQYVFSLVLRAIVNAPAIAATYADVVNEMLVIAAADGKPVQYRNFIRNRFTVREVVVSPTPLTKNLKEGIRLEANIKDKPGAIQDRSGCCGTMQLPEYTGWVEAVDDELDELTTALKDFA